MELNPDALTYVHHWLAPEGQESLADSIACTMTAATHPFPLPPIQTALAMYQNLLICCEVLRKGGAQNTAEEAFLFLMNKVMDSDVVQEFMVDAVKFRQDP